MQATRRRQTGGNSWRSLLSFVAGLGVASLVIAIGIIVYRGRAEVPSNAIEPEESRSSQQSPAIHHPEVAGMRVIEHETLDPPQAAPDFALTNYSGDTVGLAELSGKVVILSFVYTNCSEACPLLTGHYLHLQQQMSEAVGQGDVALVFVTTDPARDTPENLRMYTEGRGGKWLFLTGDLHSLAGVWERYGIYREVREGLEGIVVYHSYKTYLIDDRGRLRHRYTGVWQPSDVADDLAVLLAEPG